MPNTYPKLHNAMWPGIVGKGTMDAEPIIALDTLLKLTRDARGPNGEKFDGTERRALEPWEVAQIAGRAGRFGHHDRGEDHAAELNHADAAGQRRV